ncbi:hypothetical protein BIY21_14920 [Vibrio ponticus]|uniref:MAE-28990/MAE-18760-like HEPN domain-containing protein n=1 Tax=Vibrio ponticus TaxID=265668 RepID=A0ABX3FCY8_9VIBR|nr:hypothetical protein [Vibrio ponticus]OLQ89726.1 hypothetical protein BIY21_14920 [Vibrio ponticus]
MKTLQEHCADLVQFFGALADFRGYEGAEDVAAWLNLSACIQSVDYDTSLFNTGFGVCGPADDWADRQVALQQKLVTEIARFQFCWSALEVAIDKYVPTSAGPQGKINKLCYYLKNMYSLSTLPLGYLELSNSLECSNVRKRLSEHIRKPREFLSQHGYGVYSVYQLRNEIAHGAFEIPIDDGNRNGILEDLTTSSKIVLLTIQMLMLTKYPEDYIEVFWKNHMPVTVSFEDFLTTIHVDNKLYLSNSELDEILGL